MLEETQQMNMRAHFAKGGPDKIQFAINQQLPFLVMPVAKHFEDRNEMKGLYDTGGCCNLGWLPYHTKIFEDYPEMFA